MRITYLHQYFNTPEMAGGTRSYEMARRLVAMGHEVNMVTSWREEGSERDWYETDEAGIRVHWLPVPYSNQMSYRERIQAFFRFAWKASRKAASLPADVVFATSTPLTIALPGAYAARRQKVPMVFEVRDLWPELPIAMGALNNPVLRWGAHKLEGFAYSRAQAVVGLPLGVQDWVERSGLMPPAPRTEERLQLGGRDNHGLSCCL
ncbi:glycosyltransferase [Thioalkalivibrio sp. ALE30]|uniref:glycosyltransferase n=1 Tax=Thioalkalivibrio sp. ALE30 TaxID=1158181 RepID=UPI00036E3A4B|nr:glycosyltransferase [Thioalkalivibrio sp. ALE30]